MWTSYRPAFQSDSECDKIQSNQKREKLEKEIKGSIM